MVKTSKDLNQWQQKWCAIMYKNISWDCRSIDHAWYPWIVWCCRRSHLCWRWIWLAFTTAKISHGRLLARRSDDWNATWLLLTRQGDRWQLSNCAAAKNNGRKNSRASSQHSLLLQGGHGLAQMIVAEAEACEESRICYDKSWCALHPGTGHPIIWGTWVQKICSQPVLCRSRRLCAGLLLS